jgi:long-chain acyl-CoA synthetase
MKEPTINRMFLNRIDEGGDSVRYLVPRDGTWEPMTYREVGAAAREMACGLMSLGIAKGEKVAILSSTRVEWTLADIACILCGLITVPIYPSSLPDQVEYILSHSGSRAAFVEDESQWNKLAGARGKLPELSAVILFTGNPQGKEGAIGIADLRARGTEYRAAHPDALAARMEELRPEDDLTIIYTSGTTGPPKGALIRHSNIVFDVTAALEVVPVPRGDVMLQFLPGARPGAVRAFPLLRRDDGHRLRPRHPDGGRGPAGGPPSHHGQRPPPVREVLRRRPCQGEPGGRSEKSRLRLGDFGRARGIGAQAAPVARGRMAGREVLPGGPARVRQDPGSSRGRLRFFVSGAPLAREIAEFFHAMGILILEGYGLTETPSVTSVNRVDDFCSGPSANPPGVEVRIAVDGEILIRGPLVFKEYFRNPAATREAIDRRVVPLRRHRRARSGRVPADHGPEEGHPRDLRRKNVAPQNIENLLKTDKMVSQAFVYGDRKKYLTALLTLSADEIGKWAAGEGIAERDPALLAKDSRVRAMMHARVEETNRSLAPFEQIKKFVLLGTDFSQETGELTPTLKVKRKVVVQKYGMLLDALYEKD